MGRPVEVWPSRTPEYVRNEPSNLFMTIEPLSEEYGPEQARVRREIAVAEGQLRDHRDRLGRPFAQEAYAAELAGLRDRLRDGLAGWPPAQPGAATMSTAELAGQIKALREASSVGQATVQRADHRAAGTAESVVSRIRRRSGRDVIAPMHGEPRRPGREPVAEVGSGASLAPMGARWADAVRPADAVERPTSHLGQVLSRRSGPEVGSGLP